MLTILDEQSTFPAADDNSLVQKWVQNFARSKEFIAPKSTYSTIFTINHYAGQVRCYKKSKIVSSFQHAAKLLFKSKVNFNAILNAILTSASAK